MGGQPFSRGALFHLLRNRLYLGQIVHRGVVHDGEHDAIVSEDMFARVQSRLDANARRHRATAHHRVVKAPLTGKLFDAAGDPMSPTFSRGKSGRSYSYYVSASLQQGSGAEEDVRVRRLSAPTIERVVGESVIRWRGGSPAPFDIVNSVRLIEAGLAVELVVDQPGDVALRLDDGERILDRSRKTLTVLLPLALPLRGGRRLVIAGSRSSPRPDAKLIAALRKAHRMLGRDNGMPMMERAPVSLYDRRILQLAFLAPDIQRDIIVGRQPAHLNLERLTQMVLPLAWSAQREALDWPTSD